MTWTNEPLSRLMLGTAQFGMPYGVANRSGQPSNDEVLAIVTAAFEGGVTCFDTAATYGTSEEVLGQALHGLGIAHRVVVVTKVRPLTDAERLDSGSASRAIEQSVANSRQRLRLDCLPFVLFHREEDAIHCDALRQLQARGWLRWAGVSCSHRPESATALVAAENVSALQVPASLLDRRHQQSGLFQAAPARGVALFVRSVYLQGLLIMPEAAIPAALRGVLPVRRRLDSIAQEAGMPLTELALRYVLSQPGVTSALTGVETVAQLRENLAIAARGPLPKDVLLAIDRATPKLPDTLLTPSLWPQVETSRF